MGLQWPAGVGGFICAGRFDDGVPEDSAAESWGCADLELYGCRLYCVVWSGVYPLYTGSFLRDADGVSAVFD